MASRNWYTAIGGKQEGPFPDERLRELIAAGVVRGDTLVWCEGMTDWAEAGAIPGLMTPPSRRPSAMPPGATMPAGAGMPAGSAMRAGAAAPTRTAADGSVLEPLSTDVPMWPLLGRSLLVAIAEIVVIPLPWVATSYYQWFVSHIQFPHQQRVAFVGKPLDIWYVFIAYALCGYAGFVHHYVQLATIFLTTFLLLMIIRWFLANLVWQGRAEPLQFTGSYWGILGWTLFTIISLITIIGWAWVTTAYIRWICRNVTGSDRQLVFTASGWEMLWRTVVFSFTAIFIIPIPWTFHWYVRWLVSQFALTSGAAAPAWRG